MGPNSNCTLGEFVLLLRGLFPILGAHWGLLGFRGPKLNFTLGHLSFWGGSQTQILQMEGRSTEPKGASRAWNISMLASSCQIRKNARRTARCEISDDASSSLRQSEVTWRASKRRLRKRSEQPGGFGSRKSYIIWKTAERLAGESRRISSQAGKLHGIRRVTGYGTRFYRIVFNNHAKRYKLPAFVQTYMKMSYNPCNSYGYFI
jgi:hypothetical protein